MIFKTSELKDLIQKNGGFSLNLKKETPKKWIYGIGC